MSQNYIRKVSLLVRTNTGEEIEIVDLSNLHIIFKTTANLQQTPNSATIKIYNLNNTTYKKVIENSEGGEVTLSAGYEGNFGIIFKGQIIQIFRNKESNIDSFLTIVASDGDSLYNDGFISTSEAKGSTPNSRLYTIVNNSTVPTEIAEIKDNNKEEPKSVRGRVYFGMVREELRTSAYANGRDWYIKDGKIVILNRNIYNDTNDEITVLNHKTGMVGFPTQTQEGINVRCLLNPNIVEGKIIQVNSNSVQLEEISTERTDISKYTQSSINLDGNYRILQVTHEGDSRGNDWYTNLITVNADIAFVENKAQQEASTIPTVIPLKN